MTFSGDERRGQQQLAGIQWCPGQPAVEKSKLGDDGHPANPDFSPLSVTRRRLLRNAGPLHCLKTPTVGTLDNSSCIVLPSGTPDRPILGLVPPGHRTDGAPPDGVPPTTSMQARARILALFFAKLYVERGFRFPLTPTLLCPRALPEEGVVKDRRMGATHHPGFVVVLCLRAYFDGLRPSYAPPRIFALPENTFQPFKTPSEGEGVLRWISHQTLVFDPAILAFYRR